MKGEKVFYSYAEALDASLVYFGGDELAASTWVSKYALKDSEGRYIEPTPDAMHRRMAKEFARAEARYKPSASPELSEYGKQRRQLDEEKIFDLFRGFRYIVPQGSVMSSLGDPHSFSSLSNCVVLPPVYDSYGGIFYTDQQIAQLCKRRCGVGIDLSTLRPEGVPVSNAARATTGAWSFMERFSNTTREVAQHGRRGALMITMDVAHPDIERFVTIKQDLSKVTGANVSVRLSNEFMRAVESDSGFTLRWPVDSASPSLTRRVNARELWRLITQCAHSTAEPGLLFWDRHHEYSTSSIYPGFKNVSTNPCSEVAMQGGDSCRLIAINLFSFVDEPFTPRAEFNFKKLFEVTYEAQRLMDDLVDLELEAIDRILEKIDSDPEPGNIKQVERESWELLKSAGQAGRRTGLGFTALADALAALNLKFDSEEALRAAEMIMRTKCEAEFESSVDMAIERGRFSSFDPAAESASGFVRMLAKEFPKLHARMMKHGRRNISISTVAPTGTLSILTRSSSGIEPVYQLFYKRRRKIAPSDAHARIDFVDATGDAWQEFTVYHPGLKNWMDASGEKSVEKSPYHNATAQEIDWTKRLELQALVQKYVTHSISSTINLPADASVENVGEIYLEAWRKGLKGITVYREGSRSGVLVPGEHDTSGIIETKAPGRPQELKAEVVRFKNYDEHWLAVVGLLHRRPYEIFTGRAADFKIPDLVESGWVVRKRLDDGSRRYDFRFVDDNGKDCTIEGLSQSFNKEYWNYAKLISGVLRHGMPLQQVLHLVENLNLYTESINTWKTGVVRALKRFIPAGTPAVEAQCPECGDPEGLYFEEGCVKCRSCGNTKCG
jgi:ribonucleoside-diphosphate reductase alpha chain